MSVIKYVDQYVQTEVLLIYQIQKGFKKYLDDRVIIGIFYYFSVLFKCSLMTILLL